MALLFEVCPASRLQDLNDKTGSKFEDREASPVWLVVCKPLQAVNVDRQNGLRGTTRYLCTLHGAHLQAVSARDWNRPEEEGKDTKTRLHVWKDKAAEWRQKSWGSLGGATWRSACYRSR